MKSTLFAILAAAGLQAGVFLAAAQSLPVVDLLITRHQAIVSVRTIFPNAPSS